MTKVGRIIEKEMEEEREEGWQEGRQESIREKFVKAMLKTMSPEEVAIKTGSDIEEVKKFNGDH